MRISAPCLAVLVSALVACSENSVSSQDPPPVPEHDSSINLNPDGIPPETNVPDAGSESDSGEGEEQEVVGDFGEPCDENSDCESGFCVEGFSGYVCTETCLEECPEDWSCKSVYNTQPDVVFVCVPDLHVLCEPCLSDQQCNGGSCIQVNGSAESFCISQCKSDEDCPDGFSCHSNPDTAAGSTCLPDTGACDCSTANEGDVRSCKANNEIGSCPGFQICQGSEGWGACSAATPSPEICDGIDNDCDALLDEEVGESGDCVTANDFGECPGSWVCLGVEGLTCTAQTPGPEVCDYKDNNCNDVVDETFKSGELYTDDQHCGACGVDCTVAVANATAACDAINFNPPQCVIDLCEPGYYKVNDFLCSPIPGKLCDPCTNDESCLVPGAKCIPLDGGNYCSVPCGEVESCPDGYGCNEVNGSSMCVPLTGACSCDGSNLLLQKACEKTWQDPNDANAPIVICPGVELCTVDGWTACQLGEDTCDGFDNDCDGIIDGPWINPEGQYNHDEHCGICGNNCLANNIPNATSSCVVTPDVPLPSCEMTCIDGHFDVNQNPIDGCECVYAGDQDHPDASDHNCDGVDGEVLNAIFVSKTGDDSNPGSIDAPRLTIQSGIDLANSEGKRDVYVATGVYTENVLLSAGVAVYGGYSGDFLARDTLLYETAILGNPGTPELPGTVNGVDIKGPVSEATVLAGFTVFGSDNKTASGSSYAVWLVNCGKQVTVADNRIIAGDGGNGMPGSEGTSGTPGSAGENGLPAYDIGTETCLAVHQKAGGPGGAQTCNGAAVDGGAGGIAICPDFDEGTTPPTCPTQAIQSASQAAAGDAGAGPGKGDGGSAGFDAYINVIYGPYSPSPYDCSTSVLSNCSSCLLPSGQNKHGSPGVNGTSGAHGTAGGGCAESEGNVSNHLWVPGIAAAGGLGAPGGGGGGGGSAGGIDTLGCASHYAKFTDIGGSGGGGGSGGCGATGGASGSSGGGSFAVFLSWSNAPNNQPLLHSNLITRGSGGAGGHGGPGGTGGAGGAAGNGGSSGQINDATFCTAGGGNGGSGGHGGHGGGGGGGCGGVSYGIFVHGAGGTLPWKTDNVFKAIGADGGVAGVGGASIAIESAGSDGQDGVSAHTNF